jgi:hypothetical protein
MAALPGHLGPEISAKLIREIARLFGLKLADVVLCALADRQVCTGNTLLKEVGPEHQGSRLLIEPDRRPEEAVIDDRVAWPVARE